MSWSEPLPEPETEGLLQPPHRAALHSAQDEHLASMTKRKSLGETTDFQAGHARAPPRCITPSNTCWGTKILQNTQDCLASDGLQAPDSIWCLRLPIRTQDACCTYWGLFWYAEGPSDMVNWAFGGPMCSALLLQMKVSIPDWFVQESTPLGHRGTWSFCSRSSCFPGKKSLLKPHKKQKKCYLCYFLK